MKLTIKKNPRREEKYESTHWIYFGNEVIGSCDKVKEHIGYYKLKNVLIMRENLQFKD